ncbi:MAG: YggT family protein [Chloroflexi bacterium]|nr:YggT family protein [Chloroflexota bacterium]
MYILAQAISIFSQVLTFIVLAHVILSYFMNPFHPVRAFIDGLVAPLLTPIRRIVPLIGMMDFSPVILIILVQFISGILIKFFLSL